jgi:hypothetical protein
MSLRASRTFQRRLNRGVSTVEFLVVFPLAALLVLGLIQAGFIYMAKLTLNHATFMAAREGSLHNADMTTIRNALTRGLIPFRQDSTQTNMAKRLTKASLEVNTIEQPFLSVDRLAPNDDTFKDFGVKDPTTKATYIPNDHLEWRTLGTGPTSKVNIRDANLLKLNVMYGYEMKVPLISGVIKRMMCGGTTGVAAWGDVNVLDSVYKGIGNQCLRYYLFNRIPLQATAIVEMQSPAIQ